MVDFSSHPIARRWPPANPDILQLYSSPTPNGVKISIMLEEIGLPYEAHKINLADGETHSDDFIALNPNGKIPVIIDPTSKNGPIVISESIAILIYLAEKSGQLLADGGNARYETIQWAIWQASAVGPNLGNLGYFSRFGGKDIEDKRPLERFARESRRLLTVLDERLKTRNWIMGDAYTIADISLLGWVWSMIYRYKTASLAGYSNFENIDRWLGAGLKRPAVQKGLQIPRYIERENIPLVNFKSSAYSQL